MQAKSLYEHIPSLVQGGSLLLRVERGVDSMLIRCWASVVDGGPISNQH